MLLALTFVAPPALAARGKRDAPPKTEIKRNRISVVHAGSGEKATNLLLIRKDPRTGLQHIRKPAKRRLQRLLRDRATNREPQLPDNLLWYLYMVGRHFDKPIHLVSGLRQKARKTSRHSQGKAIDFRIPGVSSKTVWRYCKKRLAKKGVGLGWYPTSKFVHLDVREQSYYWIDDSGPGEPSRYRKGVRQPVEQWRLLRSRRRKLAQR